MTDKERMEREAGQTTHDEIRSHLFDRLAETAEKMRQERLLGDGEIAAAFLAVGLTVAKHSFGPVQAAEWLRDMADETEAEEKRLSGRLQ